VNLELQVCLAKYGPPYIFSYRHGAWIKIKCDGYAVIDEYLSLFLSGQTVAQLFLGEDDIEIRRSALDRPSNLVMRGKACFNVRCGGVGVMEIFWPEGE
jgi:hypothetical protein